MEKVKNEMNYNVKDNFKLKIERRIIAKKIQRVNLIRYRL